MSLDTRWRYISGARMLGGKWVRCTIEPLNYGEERLRLVRDEQVRDLRVPAGSTVYTDIDFDDLSIVLSQPVLYRGWMLPASTVVILPARGVWMPASKVRPFLLPLILLMMVYLRLKKRLEAEALILPTVPLQARDRHIPADTRTRIDRRGNIVA